LKLVREHFYTQDCEVRCIVEYNQLPIGYIQFYQVNDEDRIEFGYTDQDLSVFGMDQFIGESAYWNRGIGKQLVTSMTKYLVQSKQANRIIMDPQVWNIRAITCYERCGFKKIKLLENHELHEGEWRDCWLMEYMNIQVREASVEESPHRFSHHVVVQG
jgi:aminoglycoside 6'-N-acetyltransferase